MEKIILAFCIVNFIILNFIQANMVRKPNDSQDQKESKDADKSIACEHDKIMTWNLKWDKICIECWKVFTL